MLRVILVVENRRNVVSLSYSWWLCW